MLKIILNLRSWILVYLTHRVALPILKVVRKPQIFPYTLAQLQLLTPGSLGHDLYVFLSNRNLRLLPYYARHDLKHIVLQYDTTDCGEASLQCFMLGNGRISFPVLATVVFSVCTMPENWSEMKAAFLKGRRTIAIHNWNWAEMLPCQTARIRKEYLKAK